MRDLVWFKFCESTNSTGFVGDHWVSSCYSKIYNFCQNSRVNLLTSSLGDVGACSLITGRFTVLFARNSRLSNYKNGHTNFETCGYGRKITVLELYLYESFSKKTAKCVATIKQYMVPFFCSDVSR